MATDQPASPPSKLYGNRIIVTVALFIAIAMVVIVLSVWLKTSKPPMQMYDEMQHRRYVQARQIRENQGITKATLLLLPLVEYRIGGVGKFRDIEEQRLGTEGDKEDLDSSLEARLQVVRPVEAYFRQDKPKLNRRESASRAEPSECPICTQPFIVNDIVRILPCDHQYHQGCVDPWLLGFSGTCPVW
ncbi:uncharacterized protein A1O5_05786 [Cladophialophora psammophila CBS 110553]|uniref:RING-type domain-containing protein n=1 Tax=Cladophialophora psammophila CBS 110553 TaxID=1182543 RepID=W9X1I5_9EURO|nr:uncharacterized protein A1O5_05786 [Cladophialophora psammophila CBS 110553]EXJ70796.1 hypothetical protein A1O5_05786 [Cladophialophora psammophila CBS 110553]